MIFWTGGEGGDFWPFYLRVHLDFNLKVEYRTVRIDASTTAFEVWGCDDVDHNVADDDHGDVDVDVDVDI